MIIFNNYLRNLFFNVYPKVRKNQLLLFLYKKGYDIIYCCFHQKKRGGNVNYTRDFSKGKIAE